MSTLSPIRRRCIAVAKPTRESIVVDRLLAASRYHTRAIRALANPKRFALTARYLERLADAPDLLSILWERPGDQVRMYRVGVSIGIIEPRTGKSVPSITRDELRADLREASAVALAALGEPIEWTAAPLRVRAAWCLNALVASFRRRP